MNLEKPKLKLAFIAPLLIFLALAIFLGIGLTLDPKDLPSTLIDKQAPSFSLARLSNQSEQFVPEQLKGQRWILNVWASWCISCRVEHPLFNQLAKNTDIPLVGLNYKDTVENAQQWLDKRGNPYDYIPLDLAGNVGIDWGVYGVPETFVIDEQGLVIYKHTGPLSIGAINDNILPLFNQQGS